jgi:hypothetical protein
MLPLLARCHLGLGRLLSRGGRRSDGEQHLAAAAAMFEEMGIRRSP